MPEEVLNEDGGVECQSAEGDLVSYSCYCPKVVAMIGRVPDTIADRSVVIRMERKLLTEKCEPLTDFHPEKINGKCARFALDFKDVVKNASIERIVGLNDRAADTWEPMAVIARIAGEAWEQKLDEAAQFLSSSENTCQPGPGLLLDMLMTFVNGMPGSPDKIFSRDMASILRGCHGCEATQYFGDKEINERTVAETLGRYGIKSCTIRLGSRVARGYCAEDFKSVLRRYVPRIDVEQKAAERGSFRQW